MFFAEKIQSIGPNDRVLEIGPGATPHSRSNAFLELEYSNDADKVSQRGGGLAEGDFGSRPLHHYDGRIFPFADGEFDYVICSHVIEHVADPVSFMKEVFRVGKGRGYLEYPLITYEYIYAFAVHLHFMKFDFDRKVLRYLPKGMTSFREFSSVQSLFYATLAGGWDDLCAANKHLFFEGFEFIHTFDICEAENIELLCPSIASISPKSKIRKLMSRLLNKLSV